MRSAKARVAAGLDLHYVEQGDSNGEVALFIHGWPDSWFSYSSVMEFLPPTMRAVAPDLRGFGDSDRPAHAYEISDFSDDVVSLMDSLLIDRATIVGHSMGTFVARHLAISHPERVERLVLIGSGLSPAIPVLREVQSAMADLPDPIPEDFVREFQSGTAYLPLPPPFFERIVEESLKAPARVWKDAFDGLLRYDDSGSLSRISAPALLIRGQRDAIFESEEDQQRLVAAIPRARLSVYAETGHCPNWERPEQVSHAITEFIGA